MKATYTGFVLGLALGVVAGGALAYLLWDFHPLRWIAAVGGGLLVAMAIWLPWARFQRGQERSHLDPGSGIWWSSGTDVYAAQQQAGTTPQSGSAQPRH